MSPTKIMLIRHAEKPIPDGANGSDADGNPDRESLSAIGWERANRLVGFFSQPTATHIDKPDFVFAAAPEVGSKRPAETVTPLVQDLWPQDERASHFNQSIRKKLVTQVASAIMTTRSVELTRVARDLLPAFERTLQDLEAALGINCWKRSGRACRLLCVR